MSFDQSMVDIVTQAANGAGVPVPFALGIAQQESAFDPQAHSPAGAFGLMQLLPGTADWMLGRQTGTTTLDELMDPVFNATVGTKYLAWLLKRYAGDTQKAAAAYNWGPGNVPAALPFDESRPGVKGTPMPSETKTYWKKVLNNAAAWAGKVTQVEASVANTATDVAEQFKDQAQAFGWTDQSGNQTGAGTLAMLGAVAIIGLLLWWSSRR